MKNKVYLVGAGPGNPKLLTAGALETLRKSDVVLYDRLVGKGILGALPKRTLKVYVGERHGDAARRQERIYSLIRGYHARGLTVARLQNGDPLLFGRGGEEIQFLEREGIPYEVIPGISSATGVPSSVGLPLTERTTSSAVLVVPGHSMEGNLLDWRELASFRGTLVILMGAGHIEQICRELIARGMDPNTPACMIERGTLGGQKIVSAELRQLGRTARRGHISSPAVTVIGSAVKLAAFYHG